LEYKPKYSSTPRAIIIDPATPLEVADCRAWLSISKRRPVESIALFDIDTSFGHSGEYVLNKLMSEHGGLTTTSNHCASSPLAALSQLRVNLSYELREGIIKHETEYDLSDTASEGFDPEKRGSLEAQITNIADELAYNAHDLDDGLRSELITPEQLDQLELWQMLKDSIGWNGEPFSEQIRHRIVRRLIGIEIDDVSATGGSWSRRTKSLMIFSCFP
jgi:dGTP triphosphohydrolase